MLEMASEPSDNIVLMIGICFLNDRNLLFSGVAAEVGVLNDRNLLFSGVAAEVGVLQRIAIRCYGNSISTVKIVVPPPLEQERIQLL